MRASGAVAFAAAFLRAERRHSAKSRFWSTGPVAEERDVLCEILQ